MQFRAGRLPGLVLIEPRVFADDRGFFQELFHRGRFADAGIDVDFVQDNLSRSKAGVVRGLHYQIEQPQGKLVRALRGEVFDVAVDLRRSSPTFGQWEGFRLSEDNQLAVYIPPGFAHGFSVLSDSADVLYKCTALYAPQHERTLLWNDPTVNVAWPHSQPPIVSGKDLAGLPFGHAEMFS
ncbi:dTDP-4-dehydrorhamnose 3,5-epimerase [Caulifigura coniformis]|uniref:dTDP-4-dehydrorhamnose 3,5-epimerase n=1 Tax=Caulifigura coniformis TaxID=2527983 RepID=A0A517SFH5_9PLAN|nr:dTDP-4-dehydrorhamnose 3,5-epimerase [Caulifigura coniformis]QDT54881.1 dTDP-4-dehydrorhamnose 3,5-epimerase [Caulifigura coniformis]